MTTRDHRIPTVATHCGVGLHDQQDEARLAVVRGEIDAVFEAQDRTADLLAWVESRSRSPESRLLAEALIRAQCEAAAEQRRNRPDVDLDRLAAVTAGLGSARWRDRHAYDSALAPRRPAGAPHGPVRRPQRLD